MLHKTKRRLEEWKTVQHNLITIQNATTQSLLRP